jgi:hypothetical protein
VSYAVRWHGDRVALLWEVAPHDDVTDPLRLTAPGLDPGWSTTDLRGEALIGPVPPPPAGDGEAEADGGAPAEPVAVLTDPPEAGSFA